MRAKSMILIFIALGCGLVASIGISQVMDRNSNKEVTPQVEMVLILVAMTDIDIGDSLNAENVKIEEWPKDRLPEGVFTDIEEINESYPSTRFYAGEPILQRKLMESSGLQDIPIGYRVMPVKVSSETVSELVQPGDRVDILVFLPRSSEVRIPSTRTVLRDVRIYAVGKQVERIVDRDGQSSSAKTVSLIVKPKQVELLMLAGELGKLKLSLRRNNDTSDSELTGGGTSLTDLIKSDGQLADERDPKPAISANDTLRNMLERMSQPSSKDLSGNKDKKIKTTMVVLTPDGIPVKYSWNAKGELVGTSVQNGSPSQSAVELPSIQPPNPAPKNSGENENKDSN